MNVKLKFKSPFIVGGIKRVSNYIETLDYIPGNVVRAAFARYILNNCPCFDSDEVVEIDGEKHRNWVYYRNRPECQKCRLKNLCLKFDDIKFSFFYPEGTDLIPLTTMRCKMRPEHRLIDLLTEKRECPDCIKAGNSDTRVEAVSGYIKDGKDYKVSKTLFTRTAIDKYTGAAKEGMLYSIEAVTATDGENNIVYWGLIKGITDEDISAIDELRVGKYTSVGFGRCSIIAAEDGDDRCAPTLQAVENKEEITKKMKLFSERYRANNKITDDYKYFAVKFVADAKLGFKSHGGNEFEKYKNNGELKDIWFNALRAYKTDNSAYEIDKVYAEVFNFRGYDTSKVGDIREEPVHMVQKGSVIVFKTLKPFNEIFDDFVSMDGFGLDTENGFGWFEFHFGLEVQVND
ncbi:hypothetical protein ODU73_000314 [Thermoclostridium stercorarium]|uniref:Uncharacterized protein n=1 Tax=Thermoclostridium stercorarium subsp. leptospartum DSM 9219 TaxID=1346611 RepID=A0A1B1YHY7_THEST|nr:hypothetical protein [Thermoclostridium stercorarium]ANX00389.1 hypothetical protein CSTERLE_01670 [Thermoclostridium stercorarium subsp. leptospartum DSM 9219]UZQ85932.1 hypothetical protein ODU73_000314 [Thermoclostridium stercorarium]